MINFNNLPYKTKLNRLLNLGIGLAAIDGGCIIAIQIMSFLATYFGIKIPHKVEDLQAAEGIGRVAFFVFVFSILNLSAIIYRTVGLTRGLKYSLAKCYQRALRQLPAILLLFILACLALIAVAMPVVKFINQASGNASLYSMLSITLLQFALIPYGLLACIFIVDQAKNPLQAIVATYKLARHKINFSLQLTLSLLYALPFFISGLLNSPTIVPYLGLFTAVWLLYCHLLTIIVYADSLDKAATVQVANTADKNTKVVVI
jgi:hypothetical protein